MPPDFTLLKIEGPDLEIAAVSGLPNDWQIRPEVTQDFGTQWLRGKEAALLKIPSAIVPQMSNFLLNPLHPDAGRFKIMEVLTYPFDARIKK